MTTIKEDIFEISKLLAVELAGSITDEEKQALDNWRNKNLENKGSYDRRSVCKRIRNGYARIIEADSWEALENMRLRIEKEHIRRRRVIRLYGIVAIACILLILPVFTLDNKHTPHSISSIPSTPVCPILTFADGSHIRLDNETKIITPEGVAFDISTDHRAVCVNESDIAADAASGSNSITVPRGCEFDIVLQDGTHVWLNAESSISFPMKFSSEERRVIVEGEAYFKVAKNKEVPFVVEAGAQSIIVFGTEFNVNAYEPQIVTTLVNGSVRVHIDGQNMDMLPGEQSISSDGHIVKRTVNTKDYTSWKEGYFVLEGQPFLYVMNSIARWYDVDILWRAPSLYDMEFRGRIPRLESLEQVLDMLEMTKEVKFRITNGIVEIDYK